MLGSPAGSDKTDMKYNLVSQQSGKWQVIVTAFCSMETAVWALKWYTTILHSNAGNGSVSGRRAKGD